MGYFLPLCLNFNLCRSTRKKRREKKQANFNLFREPVTIIVFCHLCTTYAFHLIKGFYICDLCMIFQILLIVIDPYYWPPIAALDWFFFNYYFFIILVRNCTNNPAPSLPTELLKPGSALLFQALWLGEVPTSPMWVVVALDFIWP